MSLFISLLSELPFFSKKSKKPKDLTIKLLSETPPFYPSKRKKIPKRLTKYQILSNVLPFSDGCTNLKKRKRS